jgi:hypothetical protein
LGLVLLEPIIDDIGYTKAQWPAPSFLANVVNDRLSFALIVRLAPVALVALSFACLSYRFAPAHHRSMNFGR